ncbi:hypothetical protein BH10BDE1_BH10BDE1_23520 [soil metagenome]
MKKKKTRKKVSVEHAVIAGLKEGLDHARGKKKLRTSFRELAEPSSTDDFVKTAKKVFKKQRNARDKLK